MLALVPMFCGNVMAQTEVTLNFDEDYATLFPTIPGLSSVANQIMGTEASSAGDFTEATTSTAVQGVAVTVTPSSNAKTPSRLYATSPRLRMYSGTFTVTADTDITKIDFSTNSNFNLSATTGSLNGTTWAGQANEVVFTVERNTQLKNIVVTLADTPTETPDKVTVNIGDALMTGFSSNYALDFTDAEGISAWTATGFGDGKVILSRANVVPAGTGVCLKADSKGSYTIPTTTRSMYYANLFVGVPNGMTVQPTETVGGEQFLVLQFATSQSTGLPAFFPLTEAKTFERNKMYLHLPVRMLPDYAQSREYAWEIVFDEDEKTALVVDGEQPQPTGIVESGEAVPADSVHFDLQGRRVADSSPKKGLYIVGGHKVVVK